MPAVVPSANSLIPRESYPWHNRLWFQTNYLAQMTAMTLAFSLRIFGRENVPHTGPLLVVANHQSFLDPPIIGLAVRRQLVFLARKTLFRNPYFAFLIRSLNAVPIDQEGVGKEGIRAVVDQMSQGRAVLIFPEGERTPTGPMLPLKPGIHLLIKRTRATLLPVGVAGAFEAWPRSRKLPRPAPLFWPAEKGTCAVAIGKPLDGSRYADMPREQALTELFAKIQQVQQQAEKLRRRS